MNDSDLPNSKERFASFVHDRSTRAVSHLENKAQITFGVVSAVSIFLVNMLDFSRTDEFLSLVRYDEMRTIVILYWMSISAALSFLFSSLFAIISIWPRKSSNTNIRKLQKSERLIYFEYIRSFDDKFEYSDAVMSLDDSELISAILHDAYGVAKIADRKRRSLKTSAGFLVFGVVLFFIIQLVEKIAN